MENIIELASEIHSSSIINELSIIVNEDTLLEILAYESVLAINNENCDRILRLLEMIIKRNDLKKFIIARAIKELAYPSKSIIRLHREYNIEFDDYALSSITDHNPLTRFIECDINSFSSNEAMYLFLNRIFTEDLVDEFITLYDAAIAHEKNKDNPLNISFEADIKRVIWLSIRAAINSESIKILKYLLLNNKINEYKEAPLRVYVIVPMITIGNNEIIHLIEQAGIDFSNIQAMNLYNCHHYELIQWINNQYHIKDVNSLISTDSLIYHFLNGIELYMSISFSFDLTCVDNNKYDIIAHNCFNNVMSGKYKFNTHDLSICIQYNHLSLFKEMILRLSSSDSINIFLLKSAIECFRFENSMEFIKLIISEDIMNNNSKRALILNNDNSKNNILHMILSIDKKDISDNIRKECLDYFILKLHELLSEEEYKRFINEKNTKSMSAIQLASVLSISLL